MGFHKESALVSQSQTKLRVELCTVFVFRFNEVHEVSQVYFGDMFAGDCATCREHFKARFGAVCQVCKAAEYQHKCQSCIAMEF